MLKTLLSLLRVEFLKLRRQKLPYIALVLIVIAIILPLAGAKKAAVQEDNRQSEDDRDVQSGGAQNGFDLLSEGSSNAILIATLFLLMIASLTFSTEFMQGTMRTCLAKPVTRAEFFLGKVLLLFLICFVVVLLIPVVSAVLVKFTTGFGNIVDKRYTDYIYVDKAEMAKYAYYAFFLAVLPVLAVMAFGVLMSVLIESPGAAAMASVILGLTVHFVVAPVFPQAESYLPNTYLGFYTDTLGRLSQGELTQKWKFEVIGDIARVEYKCPQHPEEKISGDSRKCPLCGAVPVKTRALYKHSPERREQVYKSILVPSAYFLAFIIMAYIIFKRKNVLT